GMRHVVQISLAETRRVQPGSEFVPGATLIHDRVRAIRLARCIQEWTEHAEVSKLAGIGSAGSWICCGPNRITEGIHRSDERIGGTERARRLVDIPVLPALPVTEDAVPRAVRQHYRPHLCSIAL